MPNCRKCGLEIAFQRRDNKWIPVNPDYSSHWDTCKAEQRRRNPPKIPPPITTHGWPTHYWIGLMLPWNESLGYFRDFTDEEKLLGEVCAPL